MRFSIFQIQMNLQISWMIPRAGDSFFGVYPRHCSIFFGQPSPHSIVKAHELPLDRGRKVSFVIRNRETFSAVLSLPISLGGRIYANEFYFGLRQLDLAF